MLHCNYMVTGEWPSVVTIVNYQQHGDYIAIGWSVTVLPAVSNSDYSVTVQLLYLVGDWWNRTFAVYLAHQHAFDILKILKFLKCICFLNHLFCTFYSILEDNLNFRPLVQPCISRKMLRKTALQEIAVLPNQCSWLWNSQVSSTKI